MHTTISQLPYPNRQAFFEKLALSLPPQPAIKIGPAPLPGGEHRAGAGSHTPYAASTNLNILNSKKTTANHANYRRRKVVEAFGAAPHTEWQPALRREVPRL
jgi:hypothetical protein